MAAKRERVGGKLRYIDLHKPKGIGKKHAPNKRAQAVGRCARKAATPEARKECFRNPTE